MKISSSLSKLFLCSKFSKLKVKVEVIEGGFRVEEEVGVLAGDALFDFTCYHIAVSTVGVPSAKLSKPTESSLGRLGQKDLL